MIETQTVRFAILVSLRIKKLLDSRAEGLGRAAVDGDLKASFVVKKTRRARRRNFCKGRVRENDEREDNRFHHLLDFVGELNCVMKKDSVFNEPATIHDCW